MNSSPKTFSRLMRLAAGTVLALALGAATAHAGDMDLAWDAPPNHDILGYRIYYGTEQGNYSSYVDSSATPSYTLRSLSNCVRYYIAVRAKDNGALMSPEFSNEISGFAHPQIVSVTPPTLSRGETAELVVDGMSFAPGATAEMTNLTVNSTTIDGCGRMRLQVTVGENASGASTLTVTNSDGGFGTLVGAVMVNGTPTGFSVTSVSPAAGAMNVDADPTIRVTFSQPVDPRTITASRFRLLRRSAGPSPRFEAGTPSLDPTGRIVTIRINGALVAGERYILDVKGGRRGVLDSTGLPLAESFTQSAPFAVAPLLEGTFHGPSADGELQPLTDGSTIPAASVLVVKFTEPMSATALSNRIFQLRCGRLKMGVTATLSADGRSVILTPAQQLPYASACTLTIKGGAKGVQSARGVTLLETAVTVMFSTGEELEGLGVAD